MVLGTSDVRLLDMTRAYAAVANRGASVMPYAITRVSTVDGRLLYRHSATEERTFVLHPSSVAPALGPPEAAIASHTPR